jgi:hypothetical protein
MRAMPRNRTAMRGVLFDLLHRMESKSIPTG